MQEPKGKYKFHLPEARHVVHSAGRGWRQVRGGLRGADLHPPDGAEGRLGGEARAVSAARADM